jgi:hypothetical protein
MPFVGSSPSLSAIVNTLLAKTPVKNKLKNPHPTGDRALPATIIYDCDDAQQAAVKDTFTKVTTKYVPEIRRWGGAGPTLADRLAQRNLANTWVSCKNCSPYASLSFEDSGDGNPEVRVCYPAIPRALEFDLYLFQELLVLAGATLFDVIIVESYFSDWDLLGTRAPTAGWSGPLSFPTSSPLISLCRSGRRLTGMYSNSLAGTFMVWDPWHGTVSVGNAVNPSKPGTELIADSDWTATC